MSWAAETAKNKGMPQAAQLQAKALAAVKAVEDLKSFQEDASPSASRPVAQVPVAQAPVTQAPAAQVPAAQMKVSKAEFAAAKKSADLLVWAARSAAARGMPQATRLQADADRARPSPGAAALPPAMAPAAMKSMKAGGKPMTKTALAQTIADGAEMKRKDVVAVLDSLHGVAASELKKAGKFTIPGVCMVKTRQKPATKAGKREVFGKVVMVKAKPAKTVVKAFCVAALKKEF